MKDIILKNLEESIMSFNNLMSNIDVINSIAKASELCSSSIKAGGKILICGNGGSAADSQHFAAELIGRFYFDRQPLPAIALSTDSSILTCVGNDYSFDDIFSRQVSALALSNDVIFGISTSGKSSNVLKAFEAAKDSHCSTLLLTGDKKGCIEDISDVVIRAPSKDTARIQEMHLLIEHSICESIELSLGVKP